MADDDAAERDLRAALDTHAGPARNIRVREPPADCEARQTHLSAQHVEDSIDGSPVHDCQLAPGAHELEIASDVEVSRRAAVFLGAGQRQDVMPGRQPDEVPPRRGVRLLDGSAQCASSGLLSGF